MTMQTTAKSLCALAAFAAGLAAFAVDPSNAVLRLLNSRASGSPRAYAEAAEEVAAQAKSGKAVYAFVLGLVSRERDAPPAARLDEATRKKYLDDNRGPIKKIAMERNNPMALYLLALDSGDTNLLHRAADAGNVQAENAWGSLIFSLAPADMSDLVALYEKAGGINEEEQNSIVTAGVGQAFLITGATSRTTVQIVAQPYVKQLFEGK